MAFRALDRTPTPEEFTRVLLQALALAVVVTVIRLPTVDSDAPRENHLSVLGLVLPDGVWTSPLTLLAGLLVFIGGIALWTLSPRATLGAVLALVGLLVVGSFRVENELYARHQLFQPFAVLVVLAGGTFLRKGKLDLPAWIWTALATVVGWGYTLAGLEKLATSGLMWADGTSLRVWLTAFADDGFSRWIADTPWFATLSLSMALFVETTAVLGLTFRRTRIPYALFLLGFHVMMEWWLGLSFFGNEVTLIGLCATVVVTSGRFRARAAKKESAPTFLID